MEEQNKNFADELETVKKQAEEYLGNWKRERADFINYKKDETKRLEEFVKFANEGLILEVIDILDDLELAAEHMSEKDGLSQILKKFYELLKKYGVERIEVRGQKFNPDLHEQVFSDTHETIPKGMYLEGSMEEVRSGWTMHGKIVKPARVRILAAKI